MNLYPRFILGDVELTSFPFLVRFGSDLGAPENVVEILSSLLSDGEVEVGVRTSNRTLTIPLLIEEHPLISLASAEELLANEVRKPRNTLTIDPGDGFSPLSVFDTFAGNLVFERDDEAEQNQIRQWTLTVRALPHPHPVRQTPIVALQQPTTAPTVTMIDDGTSLTNWSSTAGTISDGGDYVRVRGTFAKHNASVYSLGSPISLAAEPYLDIEVYVIGSTRKIGFGAFEGTKYTALRVVSRGPGTAPGWNRYTLAAPVGVALTAITEIYTQLDYAKVLAVNELRLRLVRRTNVAPQMGTARQKIQRIEVAGSAPTEATLRVQSETTALGTCLIFTWPDMSESGSGYSPALKPRRISGNTLQQDASTLSGSYETLVANGPSTVFFDVPVSDLPTGTYQLLAYMRADATGSHKINWSASMIQGGATLGTPYSSSNQMDVGTANTWRFVRLGQLTLPILDVPTTSQALVRIAIQKDVSVTANIQLDECFARWVASPEVAARSAFTWVECGTGTPSTAGPFNRVQVEPATADRPRKALYRAFAADMSDGSFPQGALTQSWEEHQLAPGNNNALIVTTGALDAVLSGEYFERYHTHVAKQP